MAERRSFRDIIFGRGNIVDQREKRINFFRDEPVQPSSFVYGYNSSAGQFDLKDLGNGQSNSAVTACLQVLGVSFSEASLMDKCVNEDRGEELSQSTPYT